VRKYLLFIFLASFHVGYAQVPNLLKPPREDEPEKTEKPAKIKKDEKADKIEKAAKEEKTSEVKKAPVAEKAGKVEKPPKQQKAINTEAPAGNEKTNEVKKPAKTDKGEKLGKEEKPGKVEKTTGGEKAGEKGKLEKPEKTNKAEKQAKAAKIEKPAKAEKPSKKEEVPAQDKKKNKDFFNVKAPAIEYSGLDTTEVLFEEEFSGDADGPSDFNPSRDLSIMSEDTSTIGEGELSIVEVSEQMNVDSIWITIAEYYSIWDSKSINPYKIDGSKFDDTLSFNLYDSLSGFNWSMPLQTCSSTSKFGYRWSRWHYGIDLELDNGDPILAAFDGIVRISHYDPRGYGNYVLLRHYNGFETLYGHMSKAGVEVGQLVKAGDVIGLGGSTGRSTGPHLHYEVRFEGNAIDPENLYDFQSNRLRGKVFELTPAHFKYLKQSARKVFNHKVRSGETISSISRKYRVSIQDICRLNGISRTSTLRVGRRLRVR
jgi:murein DD-endopeptidase MepM/ murein hydrolase activator NlpD